MSVLQHLRLTSRLGKFLFIFILISFSSPSHQPCCGRVCVWTICTDVKLHFVGWCFGFGFLVFELCLQGGSESHSIHCPTKTVVWDCDIGTDHPDVPAFFQFIVNGNRLSQVPACRFSNFHFGFCCFWTFLRASFPTGFNPLHGFRNLNYCRFVRWNSCFLQGQRKNSSILFFLPSH